MTIQGNGIIMMMLNLAATPLLADVQFEQDVSRRLEALESGQAQYVRQAQAETETEAGSVYDDLVFSGLIQIQAAVGEAPDSRSGSDLSVDTIELGLATALNPMVSAELVLLYEEDATDLGVDVATLTFREIVGSVDAIVGQHYLPFGTFETALVNDTLVLELAETNKTALQAGSQVQQGEWRIYVFDGDVDRERHMENGGLSLGLTEPNWGLGVDYLSSLAESDGFTALVEDSGLTLEDSASAMTVSGHWGVGDVNVLGEYLLSLGTLKYDDGLNGVNFKPRALQLELDFSTVIQQQSYIFAVAWQQTENVAGLLPKRRVSLGGSTDLFPQVNAGMEFWIDRDYAESDGGTGENLLNFVAQISVGF